MSLLLGDFVIVNRHFCMRQEMKFLVMCCPCVAERGIAAQSLFKICFCFWFTAVARFISATSTWNSSSCSPLSRESPRSSLSDVRRVADSKEHLSSRGAMVTHLLLKHQLDVSKTLETEPQQSQEEQLQLCSEPTAGCYSRLQQWVITTECITSCHIFSPFLRIHRLFSVSGSVV